MLKTVIGFLIALSIGAACRWFGVPVPAPPRLIGALLVLAVTAGYLATDWWLGQDGRQAPAAQEQPDRPSRLTAAPGEGPVPPPD